MRTKAILFLLGAISLAALIGMVGRNYRIEQRLTGERTRLQERLRRAKMLSEENQKMTAELQALGDQKKLRQDAQRTWDLRGSIQRTQLMLHNLDAAAVRPGDPQPTPVWPEGAEVIKEKDWAYVGNKTPRDLFESFLWASVNGNTTQLAGLVGFQPEVKTKVQAMFDQLPDETKAEYGTPEKVIATMIAATMPADLQAVSIQTGNQGKYAVVMVRDEQADATQQDLFFRANPAPGGWQLQVPSLVVTGFLNKLTGGRTMPVTVPDKLGVSAVR